MRGTTLTACALFALVVVVLGELAMAAPAEAQTPITLVKNTGQSFAADNGLSVRAGLSRAQGFTTGGNTAEYVLSSVEVHLILYFLGREARVSIYRAHAGSPNTLLYTLAHPLSATNRSLNMFTAPPNAFLQRNTSYFVVVEAAPGSSSFGVIYPASSDQDHGGADGWSLSGDSLRTVDGNWERQENPVRISVNGVIEVPSPDATLRDLALADEDDNRITLNETFASGRTEYTASVPNDVDQITIKATSSASGATVEYLDAHNMTIADEDSTEDGLQVSLAEGENTIKVKVTATDGVTTKTYTVTVNPRLVVTVEVVPGYETVEEGDPVRYRFVMSRAVSGWQGAGVVVEARHTYTGGRYLESPISRDKTGISAHREPYHWTEERRTVDDEEIEADGTYTVRLLPGPSYTVGEPSSATMTIEDNDGGSVPPAAPARPRVTPVSATVLDVSWRAPADNGAPLTGYEVHYCAGAPADCAADTDFTSHSPTGTATSATLTGLGANTGYQVRVRALNVRGAGDWSPAGSATTPDDPGVTVSIAGPRGARWWKATRWNSR